MTDVYNPDTSEENQSASHLSVQDGLTELRHLLFGPEQSKLDELQTRVDHLAVLRPGPEAVSQVLPEAIVQRSQHDAQLTVALTPTIEAALKASVQKDPQPLVDAIFPVIGPAIRKAIATALQGMVQSLNQTLVYSTSMRSLRWRIEAWRAGKAFGEVVLLRTLVYRVEQVFLIHKHTGLLLQHVALDPAATHHPDLVSGMLTAIQDFVQDSFRVAAHETLDTFQVADLTVWLEQGPHAIFAAVIRGTPPYELRTLLQDTLAAVHLEQGHALTGFAGDASALATSRPHLEACLVTHTNALTGNLSPLLWIVPTLVLLALAGWGGMTLRDHWRWAAYIERLNAEPGIVVMHSATRWGHYVVAGLRDPLATEPAMLLQGTGLHPDQVTSQWEPYQALYPTFILARAQHVLQPPASVTLRFENGTLYATGVASHQWITMTRQRAPLLPGLSQFVEDRLIDADVQALEAIQAALAPPETVTLHLEEGVLSAVGTAPHAWIEAMQQRLGTLASVRRFQGERLVDGDVQQFTVLKTRIESSVLRFFREATQLAADQEPRLQELTATIQALYATAQVLGKSVRITIIGHTDKSGAETINRQLSQQRAEQVQAAFVAQGIEGTSLAAVGAGAREPLREERTEQDKAFNRSVSFRVLVLDALR